MSVMVVRPTSLASDLFYEWAFGANLPNERWWWWSFVKVFLVPKKKGKEEPLLFIHLWIHLCMVYTMPGVAAAIL